MCPGAAERQPPEAAGEAPEHEPLCQQEERGREHAGRGSADGQRLAAEGRDGTGARFCLLRASHRPHQHLLNPANPRGCAAHLYRCVPSHIKMETVVEKNSSVIWAQLNVFASLRWCLT